MTERHTSSSSVPVRASGEPQKLVSDEEIEHMKRDSHFDPLRERLRAQAYTLRTIADRINSYLSSPAQCSVEAASKYQGEIRAAASPSDDGARPNGQGESGVERARCHETGERMNTPSYLTVELLQRAKAKVAASPLYKRFIAGTPLENDIAVWMADFAGQALHDVAASAAPLASSSAPQGEKSKT